MILAYHRCCLAHQFCKRHRRGPARGACRQHYATCCAQTLISLGCRTARCVSAAYKAATMALGMATSDSHLTVTAAPTARIHMPPPQAQDAAESSATQSTKSWMLRHRHCPRNHHSATSDAFLISNRASTRCPHFQPSIARTRSSTALGSKMVSMVSRQIASEAN